MFELQTKWIGGILSGRIPLPSAEDMMEDVKAFYLALEGNTPKRYTHNMGETQATTGTGIFSREDDLNKTCYFTNKMKKTCGESLVRLCIVALAAMAILLVGVGVLLGLVILATPKFNTASTNLQLVAVRFQSLHANGSWNIRFSIKDPMNAGYVVRYRHVQASVLYENETVSSAMVDSFYFDHHHYADELVVTLNQSTTSAQGMAARMAKGGALNFTFKLDAGIKATSWPFMEIQKNMSASCDDVKLFLTSIGNETEIGTFWNGPRQCHVCVK